MRSFLLVGALAAAALAGCGDASGPSSFRGCAVVGTANVGGTTGGMLASGDCTLDEDGSYIDYYSFRIESARTVVITLSSSTIDPYLWLYGGNGALVAHNDDIDISTLNSRVTVQLQPGSYVVGANSAFEGETGAYTLTIQ